MKLRECVVVILAITALAAGPPPGAQPTGLPPEQPSAWSKLKSGARRLLPGAESHPAAAPDVRYDAQVRPATAVTPEPRRRSFFKAPARPRRTLSEYMAWEKP